MEFQISKTFMFFGEAFLNYVAVVGILFVAYNLFRFITRNKKTRFKWYLFDRSILLLTMVFSLMGFAIGLLVGYSLSPVVHVVIPALLTFYGGFLTYLFSKGAFEEQKRFVGILLSVMGVAFFLLYGIEVGGKERDKYTESQKKFDLYYLEQEEAIKKKYK